MLWLYFLLFSTIMNYDVDLWNVWTSNEGYSIVTNKNGLGNWSVPTPNVPYLLQSLEPSAIEGIKLSTFGNGV